MTEPANDSLDSAAAPGREPMRSVHTSTFPQTLAHLGISLLVTTYQAGKLVALRADEGMLNTHFRVFQKPMGLAVEKGSAGHRHGPRDLGVSQPAGRGPQAGAGREARCLLPAAPGFPDLLNEDSVQLDSSFELPDDALANVPEALKGTVL